jgi:hypothetical protein
MAQDFANQLIRHAQTKRRRRRGRAPMGNRHHRGKGTGRPAPQAMRRY